MGRLPVNYSHGLLCEIPPIKPCGRLRRLRFAFSMHDDDGVCRVWAVQGWELTWWALEMGAEEFRKAGAVLVPAGAVCDKLQLATCLHIQLIV